MQFTNRELKVPQLTNKTNRLTYNPSQNENA